MLEILWDFTKFRKLLQASWTQVQNAINTE